jgi:ABC-type multidrug transport system ATPase subunit
MNVVQSKVNYDNVGRDVESYPVEGKPVNTLHFDVSFSVMKKDKKSTILHNVSDVVQSGQMLAIMGPSGAGKTTLLRVLTMEAHGGVSEGKVTVNGMPLTSQLFKGKCGLVAQEDYHWAFLTCRETIAYAADLLSPGASAEEKTANVNRMITRMGLDSCADTLVGNAFQHGLSGGQKRRLSVAVALMKRLEIIFLDEPTSGLDAAAAAGIMEFLKDLTKSEKLVTIFTVHQPSTHIFNSFDRVMLLSKGRTAFVGRASDVSDYFARIGHLLPKQTNPAEFMLDIVNTDFTDDSEVNKILDAFDRDEKPHHQARMDGILQASIKDLDEAKVVNADLYSQILIMFHRHAVLSLRDPMVYLGRLAMFFIATIFFAIVYIEGRDRTQDQALSHLWLSIWCIGVPTNAGVIAVYVFNNEFFTIKKEVKNGMVQPLPYLIANSILQIPVMFLFGLSAIAVSEYGMLNYYGPRFGQMLLLYALTMYSYESIAQLFAVLFSNPLLGMLQYVNIWFASFLFNGIFLPVDQIPWPFRVFSYILPFLYSIRSMAYQEYAEGPDWGGAVLCDPVKDSTCLPGGYKCPGVSDVNACYGRTGVQVLDSIHNVFDTFNSNNTFNTDVAILIAIAIVCKIFFVLMMSWKARNESKLVPATASSSSQPHKLPDTERVVVELSSSIAAMA